MRKWLVGSLWPPPRFATVAKTFTVARPHGYDNDG